MRRWYVVAVLIAVVTVWSTYALVDSASAETQRVFEGATKCRTCHKKPESGEQYPKWLETGHAKAYQTLGTDQAKKIAEANGLGNPQEAAECLRCHVTGYGVADEFHGTKYDMTEGVGCESCHGAGGDYYKKATMKSITSGEIDGATVGLIMPNEEVCLQCHNDKSPTFAGFNFDEYVKKIAHPIPDETKAQYKAGGAK